MLHIQKKLTPYNFTSMYRKENKFIVVHYVGAVSTAKNNVDYYANNKLGSSAHYFVDEKEIWQSVEDYNRAWHCGGGLQGSNGHTYHNICTNHNSIGIEMCVKKDLQGNWYFEDETVKNTVELVKNLMIKHKIPLKNVIRHFDVTGKNCPAPYVDETKWNEFKNKITGDEIDMDKLRELEERIKALETPMIYNYVDENMPQWARETISKLVADGKLKGNEKGELGLTMDMLKILVIINR